MREAMLYVAAPGTPAPAASVKDGKFVGNIDSGWVSAGHVDQVDLDSTSTAIHSGFYFNPTYTTIYSQTLTVRLTGKPTPRRPTGVPSWPVGVSILLESLDQTVRYYCASPIVTVSVSRASYIVQFGLNQTFHVSAAGATTPNVVFSYTATSGVASHNGVTSYNTITTATSSANARPTGSISDLVPGRLTGYREWKILPADEHRPMRLGSITANSVWPWRPEVNAICHRQQFVDTLKWDPGPEHKPDEVPYPTCSCGIYARYTPPTAIGEGNVAGVIEASGRIEIGTEAFRAERARLVALYPCYMDVIIYLTGPDYLTGWGIDDITRLAKTPSMGTLEKLAATYNVPILSGPGEAAGKYPPSDVSALLGKPEPEPEPPGACPCSACRTRGPSRCPRCRGRRWPDQIGVYYCSGCGINWTG